MLTYMTRIMNLKASLESWFRGIGKALLAFSGGIDSSLVVYVARKELGKENVVAVISASSSLKQKELSDALDFCAQFDINYRVIETHEMYDPNYLNNPINRCYYCKSALYQELSILVKSIYKGYRILNGSNFSDHLDYRPGHVAADEYRILSPLAICKFTKDDIRQLSLYYQLPIWNKPASPCLSSRIPYGEIITTDRLKMIEKAEDVLYSFGFNEVRVRFINVLYSNDREKSFDNKQITTKTARIEVPLSNINKLKEHFTSIKPLILALGFDFCEIDPEGLVSGKLNRKILM